MTLSRRDLLSASALLLAGPGAMLRAAAGETATSGGGPLVLCWNENPYGPSPAARAATTLRKPARWRGAWRLSSSMNTSSRQENQARFQ